MSVRVVARCRPPNFAEQDGASRIVVCMKENNVEVSSCPEGSGGRFCLDEALWSAGLTVEGNENPHASQDTVYRSVAGELLRHFLAGSNGCIFAYGPTGSGKTYSMMGTPADSGIIPRVASSLFAGLEDSSRSGGHTCVEVSYFEIHNEKLRCLLCPKDDGLGGSTLRVREHPKFGSFVEGLTKFVVSSEMELLRLLNEGNRIRATGATGRNASSSHSHAVFVITLTQRSTEGSFVMTRTSKLNLVDLAGSERRLSTTITTDKRLAGGVNICTSLTCLGNVINRLAEVQELGRAQHIPYRDSVLTWILKTNLGGNSKTVMLATISPLSLQYDETMHTLQCAERAKKIVNRPCVNETNKSELVLALWEEIEQLRSKLQCATESERATLVEQLTASEMCHKELQMSFEEKLMESRRLMREREKHMLHLEEQLRLRRGEAANLSSEAARRERRTAGLLGHTGVEEPLKELTSLGSAGRTGPDEFVPSGTSASRTADDTTPQRENVAAVRRQDNEGGTVSVRALVKVFESLETGQPAVKRMVGVESVPCHNLVSQRVSVFEGKDVTDLPPPPPPALHASEITAAASWDDKLSEDLMDMELFQHLEQEERQKMSASNTRRCDDGDVDLDLLTDVDENEKEAMAAENNIDLDIDLDFEDDIDEAALGDLELEIDGDENDKQSVNLVNDDHVICGSENINKKHNDSTGQVRQLVAMQLDLGSNVHRKVSLVVENDDRTNNPLVVEQSGATATARSLLAGNEGLLSVQKFTTLVVPSHSLPNNHYLFQSFKVVKKSEGIFKGGKKDRIWVVDFFKHCFSNLDMAGYVSFAYSSSNLIRVEKDSVNSKCLTLYFLGAPHPYALEFTSTLRRQRFYELAMTLRRNAIMWCPSLCVEGEEETLVVVKGTTIERPNATMAKVRGETQFMATRTPHDIVDMWYGCFSLKQSPLPQSATVLGSFLPRESHEVYVIGVMDLPHSFVANDLLCKYFLDYLGSSMHFVLANTTVHSKKKKNTSNAFIVIGRRSFALRASSIDAVEATPVVSNDISRGEFTAVGCTLRINETTMGIILVNAKPMHCSISWRAAALRTLMSSFSFCDTSVDIGVRFNYFIVSGAFNLGADFRPDDVLPAQMRAGNLMSSMMEAAPGAALVTATEPIRIFYATSSDVCRLDVRQYTASSSLGMPNAFVSISLFTQRVFLDVFGEQVPPLQLGLDSLCVHSVDRRIPSVLSPELRISAEWISNSPLLAKLLTNGSTYEASGQAVPMVIPTISNTVFLGHQTITFSLLGVMRETQGQQASVIASGVLPLKNICRLGEFVEFSVSMYYRACCVGRLTGKLLLAAHERCSADLLESCV